MSKTDSDTRRRWCSIMPRRRHIVALESVGIGDHLSELHRFFFFWKSNFTATPNVFCTYCIFFRFTGVPYYYYCYYYYLSNTAGRVVYYLYISTERARLSRRNGQRLTNTRVRSRLTIQINLVPALNNNNNSGFSVTGWYVPYIPYAVYREEYANDDDDDDNNNKNKIMKRYGRFYLNKT